MIFQKTSRTTIVKCLVKASILDSEGKTNSVTSTYSHVVDSFADFENDLVSVQDLAHKTNNGDTISLWTSGRWVFDSRNRRVQPLRVSRLKIAMTTRYSTPNAKVNTKAFLLLSNYPCFALAEWNAICS